VPNRIKFTQLAVDRLRAPEEGRVIYWDSTLPGFGLRISAPRPGREARKVWIAMYRVEGNPVMETIDTLANVPKVEKARELARASLNREVKVNPVVARRAEAERRAALAVQAEAAAREAEEGRFAQVAERFLKERGRTQGWSPGYASEARRILEHDVIPCWGDRPIRGITSDDVKALLHAKSGRRERPRKGSPEGAAVLANRVLAQLRTLFRWALGEKLIAADPTMGVNRPVKERARDRVLDDDEIVLFWRGAERAGWPFGAIFKLLLLTAQRESEVAGMRWTEIDVEKRVWTIPRERTKSDRGHIVHLSEFAVEILGALPRIGDCVFPTRAGTPVSSFSRAKQRLDALMTAQRGEVIAEWTLHDLRRCATTIVARLNIPPHVADKILNHSTGTIRGVAATYNRFAYLDERKAALEALGRFVEALVRPGGARNIVEMRRA
jgi:integrase